MEILGILVSQTSGPLDCDRKQKDPGLSAARVRVTQTLRDAAAFLLEENHTPSSLHESWNRLNADRLPHFPSHRERATGLLLYTHSLPRKGTTPMRTLLILGSILAANSTLAEDLPEGLLFQASFDGTTTAKVAQGDAKLYSAKSLQGEDTQPGIVGDDVVLDADGGRAGGALRFLRKSSRYLFYRGNANLPYSKSDFSGTVSLWLRVTPDEDLPQGYVDPLQITDKKME